MHFKVTVNLILVIFNLQLIWSLLFSIFSHFESNFEFVLVAKFICVSTRVGD